MKMLGSCLFSGLRRGLALPNSGCCGGFAAAFSGAASLICFGDGDCIFALMLARGVLSAFFVGDRCWPLDVRSGLRSFTILLVAQIGSLLVGSDSMAPRRSSSLPSDCASRARSEKEGFLGEERVFVGRKPWRRFGDSAAGALYDC